MSNSIFVDLLVFSFCRPKSPSQFLSALLSNNCVDLNDPVNFCDLKIFNLNIYTLSGLGHLKYSCTLHWEGTLHPNCERLQNQISAKNVPISPNLSSFMKKRWKKNSIKNIINNLYWKRRAVAWQTSSKKIIIAIF